MRRVLWFALGATVAVVLVAKGRDVLRNATPAGVADRLKRAGADLAERAAEFVETLTEAMAEREDELKDAMEPEGGTRATEAAR